MMHGRQLGFLAGLGSLQSLRALLAQALGLVVTLLLAWGWPTVFYGGWRLAVTQALAATLCARLLKQPAWWLPIHLLFAPGAMAALTLHIPSTVYLAAFVLCALVFWGTVRGDVPLFLSSRAVAEAVVNLCEQAQARRCVDLGAGLGSVAVPLAKHLPAMTVEAWEQAPIPWAACRWRGRKLSNLKVYRDSFWHCDLSGYDVVFAFLSPAPMARLGEKVQREMRPGTLFISSSFPVPEWTPESVLEIDDAMGTRLYCYRITGEQT